MTVHCVSCGANYDAKEWHVCKRRYVKIGNYYTLRPQAEPYHVSWQTMALDGLKEAGEIILGVVVFLALFIGIPLLLWLVFA